jgi:hypothetical protein
MCAHVSTQQGDVLSLTAEAEVERACALMVGRIQGHDGKAEGGAEVLPILGNAVGDGVQREELGFAARPANTC